MEESQLIERARILKFLLHVGIVGCGILWIIAHFFRIGLPETRQINPELLNPPRQEATIRDEFLFNYRGVVYDVEPVAEYELTGLVVSHNNINSLVDIYHDDDSVDLKDICIIWGTNVQTNDFHEVEFSSNAWTCSYSYFDNIKFNHSEIANNHLLAADRAVQNIITELKIGDQVKLKGALVNYRRAGSSFARQSSLNRDDTGNGACEVMFVEDAEVIATSRPIWQKIFNISSWAFFAFLGARIMLFLIMAHHERKNFEKYEKLRLAKLEQRSQMSKI